MNFVSINKVCLISFCSKQHADVWKLTSALLTKFLHADEYKVYVPEEDVSFFLEITNPKIKVLSEKNLGNSYRKNLEDAVKLAGNEERLNWYLQQFYKIEAAHNINSSAIIIWDADCVPVKEIKLFNNRMNPIYMNCSKEFNKLYFDNIERLLEMKKIKNQSFITPGFPILKEWLVEFLNAIEKKHKCFWAEAIIKNTNFQSRSGFSEFETLGTWVANSYPNNWVSEKKRWERYGSSRFGSADKFSPEQIIVIGDQNNLDIISFENWDTMYWSKNKIIGIYKKIINNFSKIFKN